MREKRLLHLIVGAFILLGLIYAFVTPPFEASDELWHYPMIRHLADGNALPVQVYDPAQAGPWRQEASQPPLYYYLGAALTFWIDTGDMETVRWLNPHVDNGVITADGNTNLAIHDPAWSHWQGTLLAVRLVRILSVFLGAATVYLTYRIGTAVAPHRPDIALGAAALNAFTPMFLFISGAVNNDNLAIPLASLGVLLLIRLVTDQRSRSASVRAFSGQYALYQTLLIGVVTGLAVLTKQGTIGLIPLAWGTFFIYQWQTARLRRQIKQHAFRPFSLSLLRVGLRACLQFALMLIPVLLIAGWWYYRNMQLYGDWLGWSAFIAVLGERETPATLAQLWDERWGFMLAYWGLFGGVNVPMWDWIYWILNALVIAAVPGFIVYAFKEMREWKLSRDSTISNPQPLIANLLDLVVARFPLVVCLVFSAAVVYGLVQWATTTWSSQGRLVFTAISTLNILWVLGLIGWLPLRLGRWIIGAVAGFLFIVAAMAPWLFIRPAYAPSRLTASDNPPAHCRLIPNSDCVLDDTLIFGDQLLLASYALERETVRPGEAVGVTLEWDTLAAPSGRDWSAFVHLNDPVLGVPIAQRDMYLGQGLLPTTLLAERDRIVNYYHLQLPRTAVAPAELELVVGFYDFHTGERLRLPDGADHATLATLQLEPAAGQTPNPTSVNFNNQFELVGYAVEPRRARPGETIDLTLYWKATRPAGQDYTFFAQLLGEDTTRWASHDLPAPTSTWPPGEIHSLTLPLEVSLDTPPDVYPIRIGIYTFSEDNGFQNLKTVTSDGHLTDRDFVDLTPVRVEAAP